MPDFLTLGLITSFTRMPLPRYPHLSMSKSYMFAKISLKAT